jgi:heme exporter protein D
MIDFTNKYAMYIWPAVAITAAVVAWTIVDSLLRARRWKREVERLEGGE